MTEGLGKIVGFDFSYLMSNFAQTHKEDNELIRLQEYNELPIT